MHTATAFSKCHLSRALVMFLKDLDPCLAYKASSEYILSFVREPHASNFKKAFLVFFHTFTYILAFFPAHSCDDQYSLLSKNYEPHAFYGQHNNHIIFI